MPMTFGWCGHLGQGFRRRDRGFGGVVRVHADGAPEVGVRFGHGGQAGGLLERGADGDHLADPGLGGARQDVRQFGRGEVVQVAVGIDQHRSALVRSGYRAPQATLSCCPLSCCPLSCCPLAQAGKGLSRAIHQRRPIKVPTSTIDLLVKLLVPTRNPSASPTTLIPIGVRSIWLIAIRSGARPSISSI